MGVVFDDPTIGQWVHTGYRTESPDEGKLIQAGLIRALVVKGALR